MVILFEILSAILQIAVFLLIPFVVFLFRKDKSVSFSNYIGFYTPPTKSVIYVIFVSLFFVLLGVGLTFIDEGIKQTVLNLPSVTGKLRLMGLNPTSITILLITALLKTSLSEEIFFRGFIAKRLIKLLGFTTGNLLQSIIFGVVHFILFWLLTHATLFALIIFFIFSTLAGWSIGYIKEKYANGSIIPGWIAHGLGNTISYFIIAYIL